MYKNKLRHKCAVERDKQLCEAFSVDAFVKYLVLILMTMTS